MVKINNKKHITRDGIIKKNPHKKKSLKTAILTPEEDKTWIKYFESYLNEGYTDRQADKYAFKDLQEEYPRLKGYDKIK